MAGMGSRGLSLDPQLFLPSFSRADAGEVVAKTPACSGRDWLLGWLVSPRQVLRRKGRQARRGRCVRDVMGTPGKGARCDPLASARGTSMAPCT